MKNIINKLKTNANNSFLAKGKHTKIKVVVAIIISIILATVITLIFPITIWDRLPIFAIIICFILLHFVFKINDLYEFIYRKRYIIALLFMIYVVLMGYSGSSIGEYNSRIQPESSYNMYYEPILGAARVVRSDEWNVNTPIEVSQTIGENKFSYYNDQLRGTDTEMYSIASSPVNDILIFGKPFFIGFILLGAERGLSFLWYGKIVALMLVSFELCMLLSNKKKVISLMGMLLITFSAATQWWNMTEYMIWGGLAILLLDKFMLTDKYRVKIACGLGIFISAISYVFILYPAWQLPFGYVFLPFVIWVIWKNRKKYKMNWKDLLIILIVILAIAGMGLRYYILSKDVLSVVSNTDYPGDRFELGGGGTTALFSYVYSMILPYKHGLINPCEPSGMISVYPIPMIMALVFLCRNKDRRKHYAFLIPMLLITILLSIWSILGANETIAKITFLYMSQGSRTAIPLGFAQILLIVYLMANVEKEDKLIGNYLSIVLAIIFSVGIFMVAKSTDTQGLLGHFTTYICGLIVLIEVYLMMNLNKNTSKKLLIALLIPIAILTGATVNPIQKGISVLTEKPVAKKVQEIVQNDPENNRWIVLGMPNYYVASGAKVINTVNTYPNFDFYKIILGEKAELEEYRKIYNRYAHVDLSLIDGENNIRLIAPDAIAVEINIDTLKDLNVKYMVSDKYIDELSNNNVNLEKIYEEDAILIYRVNY